ncbi:uncharacterized protein LOC115921323 [Strongylocentrotus purpuratus]|uniref:Uncharacterized protein n=1 Tax=Strongylocentrotus purpuratus TaxID=7668 RepID=A0A7M7NCE8_STRPU|nr:uncharacterized protein LOC115921323 [Strongylocentrotus purpuratus]
MYLSSGLSFCRMRRTSCTMDGFCLLYLLMILLMRSGDVETNPGPDRIVSEEEFIKLSKMIEPTYYKEVGVNLEIPNAELGQIIVQHLLNTNDALMTVFTRWRDKQPLGTDIRALLAEGLERSNLGSLSGELLAGSLVLKQTGEKKKEIMSAACMKAFTAIDNVLLLQAANKHCFDTFSFGTNRIIL